MMRLAILACLGLCAAVCSSAAGSFVLVEDGSPVANLVECESAAGAIRAFNDEARRCLGGRFPVVRKPVEGARNVVFRVVDEPVEHEDAYEVRVVDGRTLEISGTEVSFRWAVNRILGEVFGIKWIFVRPDGTDESLDDYPAVRQASIPETGFSGGPMALWSVRAVSSYNRAWYANLWNKGMRPVHFMGADVFPVRKYAPDCSWPREILPEIGGRKLELPKPKKPVPDNDYLAVGMYHSVWNPCFSNPRTADIAVENVLEGLKSRPRRYICLDINDNGHMCECARCRAGRGKLNSLNYPDYSPVYWKWVKEVAERVAKTRPDVRFYAIAYREVTDPPGFRLPDNVMVRVCQELTAMVDPEVHEARMAMFRGWAESASRIELYDYNYGPPPYMLPRLYCSEHARILREIAEACPLVGYFTECNSALQFNGPALNVISRLVADLEADPRRLVREWCVDAVGPAAAGPLELFYRFWEGYWTGEDVRRTGWFRFSKASIYQMFGQASCGFALKRGDMARCRAWLDEAVAKADTPMRRRRAEQISEYFEISENAATATFAEALSPDGSVATPEEAVELVRSVPSALEAVERLKSSKVYARLAAMSSNGQVEGNLRTSLGAILPFAHEPSVKAALLESARGAGLPADVRGLFRIWAGEPCSNLVENGSFEKPEPLPACWRGGKALGRRTDAAATDGAHSFARRNAMMEFTVPVRPGRTYILLFDAMCDKASSEGRMFYQLTPYAGGMPRDHVNYYGITMPGGRWQTYTGIVRTGSRRNGQPDTELYVNIYFKNFEVGETQYVDNVRIFDADEL